MRGILGGLLKQDGQLKEGFNALEAFVSSTSGVLYNNQDIIGELDGKLFKGFIRSHYDGQGVSLLRAVGIHVAFVTVDPIDNPNDPIVRLVERWNNLPSSSKEEGDGGWPSVKLIGGVVGKEQIAPVADWLAELGTSFRHCAVMGHDLVQVPLLKLARIGVAPRQAEQVVKDMADFITVRSGGDGALRDFANMVLSAKGIDPTTLPTR